MAVDWTRHRFSGGALALDVTNTVVHRLKPEMTIDRFADAAEIARFAAAATRFRADEFSGRNLVVANGPAIRPVVIELREAADALFRGGVCFQAPLSASHALGTSPPVPEGDAASSLGPFSPLTKWGRGVEAKPKRRGGAVQVNRSPWSAHSDSALARFLRACAAGLEAEAASEDMLPFTAALAHSALALLQPATRARIRICPNCDWLFLDRSRNGSRLWCDMAVCGNRAKAKRHYRRSRVDNIREDGHAH